MIDTFDGDFAWLSNFYHSPFSDGEFTYPTMEHYFQAAKTLSMEEFCDIVAASTPGQAKRLGRKVQLRPDWEHVKEQVMLTGVRLKFSQDPVLREKLIATGDEFLEEGTLWHDNEWGNCRCANCAHITGRNKLGKILMQVRDELNNGTI